MQNFFSNYETNKLNIFSPDLTNAVLILFFIALIVITSRKNMKVLPNIMTKDQTEQLRGLSIFLIILGHLWVHVSSIRPSFVLSGDAVALFLIISGFGLSMSSSINERNFKRFFVRRIKRVMIPYWCVTFLIIVLDYLILSKILQTNSIIMTLFGLNFSLELQHIDYVRWFITFLLMWYIVFFISKIATGKKGILFLLFYGIAFLPINYYYLNFGWYQFLSFPFGCVMGFYHKVLFKVYEKKRFTFIIASSLGVIFVIGGKIFFSNQDIWNSIIYNVPNIVLSYIAEVSSIIFSVSLMFIFIPLFESGYESRLLVWLGKYSYELFLLHGVFLIKYNCFIKNSNSLSVVMGFSSLIAALMGIAFLVSKVSKFAYAK
jgi:membrane-bound acyltransferase YfiQ involved in biofilm formation